MTLVHIAYKYDCLEYLHHVFFIIFFSSGTYNLTVCIVSQGAWSVVFMELIEGNYFFNYHIIFKLLHSVYIYIKLTYFVMGSKLNI